MQRSSLKLAVFVVVCFEENEKGGNCRVTMAREEQAAFAREASLEPSSFSLFALSNYDEPRSEGYDEYFDPPLESKYECPICLLGLREPVQTSCGHRFCNGCILRSLR